MSSLQAPRPLRRGHRAGDRDAARHQLRRRRLAHRHRHDRARATGSSRSTCSASGRAPSRSTSTTRPTSTRSSSRTRCRTWASTTSSCSPATRSAATSRCATRRRTRTGSAGSSCSTRRSTSRPSWWRRRATASRCSTKSASKWLWERLASSKQKDLLLYKVATGVGEGALKEAFHAEDIPTHWEIMSKNLTNTVNAATWVDDLPKLTMPVVHAIGEHDAIVKIAQAPALKRLKPDMEIRKISGLAADHMTLWNMPERIAEEIMRDEVRELNVVWRGGSGEPLVLLHGLRNPASRVDSRRRGARAQARRRRRRSARLRRLAGAAEPALHARRSRCRGARNGQRAVGLGAQGHVRGRGPGCDRRTRLRRDRARPQCRRGRDLGWAARARGLARRPREGRALRADDRAAGHGAPPREQREGDRRAAEKAEARLVPILRSAENTMLGTDAAELLAQVPAPVRFVVPSDDSLTPTAYLARVCAEREDSSWSRSRASEGCRTRTPPRPCAPSTPTDAEGIALAEQREAGRRRASGENPLFRATGGVESALLRAGVLNLVAAAWCIAWGCSTSRTEQVLTLGFALWIAVASLSAIVGAIGMKRKTAGTRFTFTTTALPTLLGGPRRPGRGIVPLRRPEDGQALLRGAGGGLRDGARSGRHLHRPARRADREAPLAAVRGRCDRHRHRARHRLRAQPRARHRPAVAGALSRA